MAGVSCALAAVRKAENTRGPALTRPYSIYLPREKFVMQLYFLSLSHYFQCLVSFSCSSAGISNKKKGLLLLALPFTRFHPMCVSRSSSECRDSGSRWNPSMKRLGQFANDRRGRTTSGEDAAGRPVREGLPASCFPNTARVMMFALAQLLPSEGFLLRTKQYSSPR